MVALVAALALSVLSTPVPAQVPSGPLTIQVAANLGEPITVGVHTVFPVNGTALLTGLVAGESDVVGLSLGKTLGPSPFIDSYDLSGGPLTEVTTVVCTGTLDDAGNGAGHCASTGQFDGRGTWAGRTDTQAHSLTLTIYLLVVCPHCVPR